MTKLSTDRWLLLIFVLPFVIFSCNEDEVDPTVLKIKEIKHYHVTYTFYYDSDGRCKSIEFEGNGDFNVIQAKDVDISYSTDGLVSYYTSHYYNENRVEKVKMIYDGQGRLVSRVHRELINHTTGPASFRTFEIDSSFYENDKMVSTIKYTPIANGTFGKQSEIRYEYGDNSLTYSLHKGTDMESYTTYYFDDKRAWTDDIGIFCAAIDPNFFNPTMFTTHNVIKVVNDEGESDSYKVYTNEYGLPTSKEHEWKLLQYYWSYEYIEL